MGCQHPDACEWNWWPDHCQCPNSDGKRHDAPEPDEMVTRNLRRARESGKAEGRRELEKEQRIEQYEKEGKL